MSIQASENAELLSMALVGYASKLSGLNAKIEAVRDQLAGKTGKMNGAKPSRLADPSSFGAAGNADKPKRKYTKRKSRSTTQASGPVSNADRVRRRRQMSPAGRARIAAATKKRWKAYREAKAAAKKLGLPVE